MAVAVYTHYFRPGSLRIKTDGDILSFDKFESLYGEETYPFEKTRKWLQMSEAPYPGYCRAPGSGKCLPTLCNCKMLTVLWDSMKAKKELLKKELN